MAVVDDGGGVTVAVAVATGLVRVGMVVCGGIEVIGWAVGPKHPMANVTIIEITARMKNIFRFITMMIA